ncbi:MAG: thermonuclease family protein [Rhodovarius sp.]|nr:thermonuclease family protein [Rhodovarius sp.]MDW8314865.1 thermonuclease family protein [Rhodovarius sp.]
MRRRRIFKPARSTARPGRTLALLGGLVIAGVLAGVLSPGDLMGSAPRTQEWRALPSEVAVLDGETLRLGDRILRLHGVSAPPRGAACGPVPDCGGAATAELARLVRDRAVECRIYGRDGFGRGLGVCRAGGVEVNAALVGAGWAHADGNAIPALAAMEALARAEGRGMWAAGPR